MRKRWSQFAGVAALVATMALIAAAFQIDPDVVTEVSTPPSGLWIPSPLTGEVLRVDAASGRVTARVPVGEPGADFVIDERENGVIVVDRTGGRVALVDPALHEVTRDVRTIASDLVDIGPDTIAMGSGSAVALIDLDVTASMSADVPGPLRSMAADGAGLVAENGSQRVAVDMAGEVGDAKESGGQVVRAMDEVVVLAADGVHGLDGERLACLDSPVGRPIHVIGTAENWVVAIDGSTIHVADLGNGECSSIVLDAQVGALGRPVVAGRRVYVPETGAGVVHIFNPDTRAMRSHAVLDPGDLRLRARDEFVVAYDASTTVAALLDVNGFVRFIDTSPGGQGIQAVLTDGGSAAVVGGDGTTPGVVVDGVDGVSASSDAPVIDAGVLATTLRSPVEDNDPADDELVANFAFSSATVGVGELARFVDGSTGSPTSWLWDFGDGTGAEGPEVEKAWEVAGTYPVTLRISRGEETAEISLAITVVPAEVPLPPAADFVFSSTVVAPGDSIDFEDRSDGEIERWRWDFGDGTTSTARNVTKSWGSPGSYTVQLTVANGQGSDSAFIVIEVVEGLRPPVAVLTVDRTEVDLGEPLKFFASSSTDPASFSWDFGDGRSSTGNEVVHVFLQQGTFTVELTAENDAGLSTKKVVIVVSPPTLAPKAAIAVLPTVIEVGDVVLLNSLSSNGPDREEWSFGDGNSAAGSRVSHSWVREGTYLVTLTATNSAGSDATTIVVEVLAELPPPVAQIGDFNASPWVGEATVFFDASIDATTWLWDFGDGVTSNAPNPLHTFSTPGPKVVILTVSNRTGTDSTPVVVEPRLQPTARFVVSSNAIRAGESVSFTDESVNAVSWFWNYGDGVVSGSQNPIHVYAESGTYSVFLTVENLTGDSANFGPVVISVDPAAPLLDGIRKVPDNTGTIVTLTTATFEASTNPSSGPIAQYEIDFGDGSANATGLSAQFSHVYGANGSYVVEMRARGPLGDWSDWVARPFTVVDPAAPAISMSVPGSAPVGLVTLTGVESGGSGPIDTWRWQVSRGADVQHHTGKVVTHLFSDAGVYRVRLTAEGPVDNTRVTQNITITLPPAPTIDSLIASPSPATTGVVVNVIPAVTGSVSKWEWDYEGSGYVAGGSTGTHIYNTPGAKTVSLRVTGPFGRVDTMSVPLTVNPRPTPSAPVAVPGGSVITGSSVNFTSTDGGGLAGLTWDWLITGPTTINLPNAGPSINHVFTAAGSWTVRVTATDALGVSGTNQTFVTVVDPVPPLNANFGWVSTGPLQIQFTDTSTGPPVTAWVWNFGDPGAVGNPAAQNPLVTYSGAGSFSVTLTATAGAQTDPVTILVTVPAPPVPPS